MYELKFSDIGEGLYEAEVLQWFVDVGDEVNVDDPIIEVQTDKAAVEITSPHKGKIINKFGAEGDIIKVGDTIAEIGLTDQAVTQTQKSPSPSHTDEVNEADNNQPIAERFPHLKKSAAAKRIIAAPSVRKYARTNDVDLEAITGSAKNGRITKQDVVDFMNNKQASADNQSLPVAKPITYATGEEERIPIKGIRKRIYENMVKSKFTIPHVTAMDEVQVDRLVEMRKSINETSDIKITYLPFIIKMVVQALKNNPLLNASIDEEASEIVLKKDYNIGVAVATDAGLIVPVIHHADQKTIEEIAIELTELTESARAGTLKLDQLQGGTFTISSTGMAGGHYATPIINHPEVAILGVHSIKEKPVILPDRQIGIGQIMSFSLSFDHRIIDGEPAGRFTSELARYLKNPERLITKMQ